MNNATDQPAQARRFAAVYVAECHRRGLPVTRQQRRQIFAVLPGGQADKVTAPGARAGGGRSGRTMRA